MKKLTAALFVLLLCVLCVSPSAQQVQKERIFKLELTETQLKKLDYCLSKSNAEYQVVTSLLSELSEQINKQAKDTSQKK